MKRPAAVVRFRALEILALVDLIASQRMDEVWLLRGEQCKIQTPDGQMSVEPIEIEGEQGCVLDFGRNPRVEVFELHNHVLRTLRSLDGVGDDMYVEVHFDEDDEFCLVLCEGLRKITEETSYRWMTNIFDRRIF